MIRDMNLKSLALAPVLCLALAFPALAEKIPLNEISRYLNSLKTAQAAFTQVNPDGSVSTGQVFFNGRGGWVTGKPTWLDNDPPDPANGRAGEAGSADTTS